MRFNSQHIVARDHRGSAVACWLDDQTELYQRPINPADPNGPWKMVTRKNGVEKDFQPDGANFWTARNNVWIRRFDDASPKLIGSASWLTQPPVPNGRVGDVDYDGTTLALSDNRLTMFYGLTPVTRPEPDDPGVGTRMIHGLICYTAGGVVKVYDIRSENWLVVAQVGPGANQALAFRSGSRIFIAYQTDEYGGVIHPIDDASEGHLYGETLHIYDPEIDIVDDARGRIGWSYDQGQLDCLFSSQITWGVGMVPLVAPPAIGPLSPPVPDGTMVNVRNYILGDPKFQPRTGPTHAMQQVLMSNGRVFFLKFGVPSLGELWSLDADDAGFVQHLRDFANLNESNAFEADTRWLPLRMAVGFASAFTSSAHEVVYRDGQCRETNRVPFRRKMWMIAAWDQFYCGKDLGTRRVIRVAYDPTDGAWSDQRYIETYYFAEGAGWFEWTADQSSVVYATGAPVWPNPPAITSSFYLVGGPTVTPQLAACALALSVPTIPEEPPVSTTMPAAYQALVKRYELVFPAPWGPPGAQQDQDCRDWCYRLAQQACFSIGPECGAKSTSPGGQTSKDVVAMLVGGKLDGWDVLFAAGGGSPTVNDPPGWVDLTGQAFIPVQPVNWLGGTISPSVRPLPPLPVIGLTSFNLGERLEASDRRWIDFCVAEGITHPRVIVARTPSASSPAVGLSRLPRTLRELAKARLTAEIVLLADTGIYGHTEASALQFVRDCVVMILADPTGVGAIQGANEPEHPTQAPFLRYASFQAKLQALIPRQFAYTFGASTHGGGGRNVGVGLDEVSYLTTHGARNRPTGQNANVSAQLALDAGVAVVKDEPIGVGPVNVPGSRTNDPAFGKQFAEGILANATTVAGGTLHIQSGLDCKLETMSAPELGAIRLFVATMRGGSVPIPVPVDGVLRPGQTLLPDVPLKSGDGRFTWLYQRDGNLVLYGPTGPRWASGTVGTSLGFVAMQGDGNCVLYDAARKARWASNTQGQPGAWLVVQNDGNVVIYAADGAPLWATGTNG